MQRGFLRSKVVNRISARADRRHNSADDGREARSFSSPCTFSELRRQQSADGFLMVDNGEAVPSVGEERGRGRWEERDVSHDDASMLEGDDLEGLDIPDDDEDPHLKDREKSKSRFKSEVQTKPWLGCSKEVYEQQLLLLNEQLTSAMIENQSLQSDNNELKKSATELVRVRKENVILSRRLQAAGIATTTTTEEVEGREASDMHHPKLNPTARSLDSYGGNVLTVTSSEEGYERVSISPDAVAKQRSRLRSQKKSYFMLLMEWVYDFVGDFTEEQSSPDDKVPDKPLSAKKLKDNLRRFSRTTKPWREFGQFVRGVTQWKNIAESLVVFLIYMYCVWHGWVISMLLFLTILMLTLFYLQTSGLAEQFGLQFRSCTAEPVDDLRFGDKLQLVKNVAQMVQNKSEIVSDSLEKTQNLFLWHQPTATWRVYINLCVFFVCSIFLPNSYILTAIGLFAGIKIFIIDNIYRKYPRVKARHDGVARLWSSLPTDAELLKRQSLTEEQLASSTNSMASENGLVSSQLSEEALAFCARFQVSPDELPLPSWHSGKRCSVMDRDRPLSLTRSGRLYLTHSCLCFERNNRSLHDPERFTIPLKDVAQVVKAKPFAVLPGSGMSIEITLVTGDKHLFSAILNRDHVFQSILDQGMILGLPWGTDIVGNDEEKNNRSCSLALGSRSVSQSEERDRTIREE